MFPSKRTFSVPCPLFVCRMAVKPVCLFLLLPLLLSGQAKKQTCLKSASTCSECILSGPQCVWCTDSGLKRRCHTLSALKRAGCDPHHVYNPQGRVHVIRNESKYGKTRIYPLTIQATEAAEYIQTCDCMCSISSTEDIIFIVIIVL